MPFDLSIPTPYDVWIFLLSIGPVAFVLAIVIAAASGARNKLRNQETIIDYLQGMIDSAPHLCYVCKEERIHANHPEYRPGHAFSTSVVENEKQQAAYKLPPTTDLHDYFDARLVPYRFSEMEELLA